MISQTNSSMIRNVYTNNINENKESKQLKQASVSRQGDTSRVEQIKNALNSGEYKVDLQALSEKIADELL